MTDLQEAIKRLKDALTHADKHGSTVVGTATPADLRTLIDTVERQREAALPFACVGDDLDDPHLQCHYLKDPQECQRCNEVRALREALGEPTCVRAMRNAHTKG